MSKPDQMARRLGILHKNCPLFIDSNIGLRNDSKMKCGYCKKEKKVFTNEHVQVLLNHPIGCDLSFFVEVCTACKKKLAGEGIEQTRGSRLVLMS